MRPAGRASSVGSRERGYRDFQDLARAGAGQNLLFRNLIEPRECVDEIVLRLVWIFPSQWERRGHEPDPIGLAVLVLDFFNKGPQRGFVGGIAASFLSSLENLLRQCDFKTALKHFEPLGKRYLDAEAEHSRSR